MILREHLELVVQKKKIDEVSRWFREHFIESTRDQYVARCPFLIIQGPPGCGKTSTLKYVADQIGVKLVDFCESTETVYIDGDLRQDEAHRELENRLYDRRRATKFEKFVQQKLRFAPLPESRPIAPSADSEFDIESDDELPPSMRPLPKPKFEQKANGVIILVESSLTFARSQRLLMATMNNIIKNVRELAKFNPRRIAIVFENYDCDREAISLPTKYKLAIGLNMIKFNPIIKTNMRKFIDVKLRSYPNLMLEKNDMEVLLNDADGDLSACLNSLTVMISKEPSYSPVIDHDIVNSMSNFQFTKRQRMNPERFKLNANLVRNVTQSCGFFHLLGKIFYQKRLYPVDAGKNGRRYKSLDRPYPPENSTEYLSGRLSIKPQDLLTWLHQHYPKFCGPFNLEKASLFLGYLSDTDTISTNSMQSTQFYEMHHILDQQQINLALEFTTFSLYEDQSKLEKSSHKKIQTNSGKYIIKSSVELFKSNGETSKSNLDCSTGGNGAELYGFSRPECLSMWKVIEDRQKILKYLSESLMKYDLSRQDPNKIIVEYLPYLSNMCDTWSNRPYNSQTNGSTGSTMQFHQNDEAKRLIKLLESIDTTAKPDTDFETQHEKLSEIIDGIDHEMNIMSDSTRQVAT